MYLWCLERAGSVLKLGKGVERPHRIRMVPRALSVECVNAGLAVKMGGMRGICKTGSHKSNECKCCAL